MKEKMAESASTVSHAETSQPVALDAERQVKAKEYARIRRRLFFVDLALGAVYIVIWLALGLHIAARDWVMS
jgi:hypothetical protein